MTYQERKELIIKPLWSNEDIKKYFECGTTKASQIRQSAVVRHKGLDRFNLKKVRVESVFETLGISYEKELSKIKFMEEERNGRQ